MGASESEHLLNQISPSEDRHVTQSLLPWPFQCFICFLALEFGTPSPISAPARTMAETLYQGIPSQLLDQETKPKAAAKPAQRHEMSSWGLKLQVLTLNPTLSLLVAEFISPQKCTLSVLYWVILSQKSVKCIHSATKLLCFRPTDTSSRV